MAARRDRRHLPAGDPRARGVLRLRRLRSLARAGRPEPPEAGPGAVPGDEVRAPALLSVRPRGGVAGARVRARVVRPLTDDPACLAAGRDAAPGAGARAGLEAV